jgi:hypothetical protein
VAGGSGTFSGNDNSVAPNARATKPSRQSSQSSSGGSTQYSVTSSRTPRVPCQVIRMAMGPMMPVARREALQAVGGGGRWGGGLSSPLLSRRWLRRGRLLRLLLCGAQRGERGLQGLDLGAVLGAPSRASVAR